MYPFNNNLFNYGQELNTLPFQTPKVKTAQRLLTKSNLTTLKKFSLNSFLDTSTKAINTFNSFVPLYHEVKPLIQNTKDIAGTLKKVFVKTKSADVEEVKKKTVIEPEIVEDKPIKRTYSEEINVEQKGPNKPFFPES